MTDTFVWRLVKDAPEYENPYDFRDYHVLIQDRPHGYHWARVEQRSDRPYLEPEEGPSPWP